jgi:hypothetical protein
MSRKKNIIQVLMTLFLTFSLLVTSAGSVLAKQDKSARMDPDFLTMVQAYPDASFKVIVQKDAKNKDLKALELEDEVLKGGGQVRKQLDLIVSFSAEMTGKQVEKLAKNPKVRWISPDAPMVSSALKPGTFTFRNEFNFRSFSGSSGTQNWSATPWVEIGEWDGPNYGSIRVENDHCVATACLTLLPASQPGWRCHDHAFVLLLADHWVDHRECSAAGLRGWRRNLDHAGFDLVEYHGCGGAICPV